MKRHEILKTVFNVVIALLFLLLVVSLGLDGYKLKLFGIKINVSYPNILRAIALFLLVRQLVSGAGERLYNVIKRTAEPFMEGLDERKLQTFTGGVIFLVFAVILGIYDSLYDPVVLKMSGYTPLSPDWIVRLKRIALLFGYYSVPSFLIGVTAERVISLKFQKEKSVNILFYIAFAGFAFLSTWYRFAPMQLDPYGPFSILDIVIFILLSFTVMFFLPKFAIQRRYMVSASVAAAVLLAAGGYYGASMLENRKMAEEAQKPHTRVLLITIDTTRGDHLNGVYGYSKETTPNINKIAEEGITFTRAYAQMPTTDPSHTSIMTGSYPRSHGLLKNGMTVSNPDLNYLQDWFKKNGFVTGAVTSRVFLVPGELGWPSFDYEHYPVLNKSKRNYIDQSINSRYVAKYAFQRAKNWIDRNYDKNFFLWVHFWDPHWPYSPPKPYNSKFNSGFNGYIHKTKARSFITDDQKYTSEEIEYTTSLYDGEISLADEYVGKLVRYLEEKTPAASGSPFVIITSDHGDSLGELQDKINYAFDHSETLHFGQLYVPLIIKWDGMLKGGRINDNVVESIDIAPTLIELLGGSGTFKCDGKSFAPFLRGEQYIPKDAVFGQRRLYSTHRVPFVNVPEYSVATNEWRLITNEIRGIELYDAINDTMEQNNLAEKEPDVVKSLLEKIEDWKTRIKPAKINSNEAVSSEKARALKSLGYVQ